MNLFLRALAPGAVAAAVLLVLGLAAPARAEYVVFQDGRSLRVASYRFEAGFTHVDLQGGGSMSFSSRRVRYVAPDEDVEEAERVRAEASGRGSAGDGWIAFADPRYVESIGRIAARHELDPALVAAVIKVESDFQPRAVSPKGARGLMQLMPGTAAELGVKDPFDVEANIAGGTAYLSRLLDRNQGNLELALAAYNAGQKAVDRARGVPGFRETKDYVARVLGYLGRAGGD